MNRRRLTWAALTLLTVLSSLGCSLSTLGYIFSGDGTVQPITPLPAKKGKDAVTVAILANADPTLGMDPAFAGAERELVALIGKKMAEGTVKEDHPVKVVEASKIEKLRAKAGGGWQNPAALGQQVGADYVIDLTLKSMSIYQPEYGREFFQGRANVQVVVYDTEKPDDVYQEYYHNEIAPQKSTAGASPAGYRLMFLNQLGQSIAFRHIPHVSTRQLPPVQ